MLRRGCFSVASSSLSRGGRRRSRAGGAGSGSPPSGRHRREPSRGRATQRSGPSSSTLPTEVGWRSGSRAGARGLRGPGGAYILRHRGPPKKWKATDLRVDLELISFGGSADKVHRFAGPLGRLRRSGSTSSTQRTSRDFSPPSRAERRACSDQPRISASRGVPGGTRDVVLSSESRRTST